jgi:hypothetical protein
MLNDMNGDVNFYLFDDAQEANNFYFPDKTREYLAEDYVDFFKKDLHDFNLLKQYQDKSSTIPTSLTKEYFTREDCLNSALQNIANDFGDFDCSPRVFDHLDSDSQIAWIDEKIDVRYDTQVGKEKDYNAMIDEIPEPNFERVKQTESFRSCPRWSKECDVLMFKEINKLLPSTSITLEDLKVKSGKLTSEISRLLKKTKQAIHWKGTIYELRKRICKVLTCTKFTARDIRKAKKLIRLTKKGKISEQELVDNFPGKSLAEIYNLRT